MNSYKFMTKKSGVVFVNMKINFVLTLKIFFFCLKIFLDEILV